MTTTFETAKVGDKVWCIVSGWGEIAGTVWTDRYPIYVRFPRGEFKAYTIDGLYDDQDLNRYLFWDEVVIDAPPNPRSAAELPLDEKKASALRDQIAIAYMQAQVQAGALYATWDELSGDAYEMADAMLKERDK